MPENPERNGVADQPHDVVQPPTEVAPDKRDTTQRIDEVLADLRDRHAALLTAGALEAAETVRAQIERLEANEQEHGQKE